MESLRKKNKILRAENKQLRERVTELESQLGDEQRKGKRQAAPFRRRNRKPKNEHKPSGRPKGHEPAHKAEPDHVDRTIDAPLGGCCPGCGGCIVEHAQHVHHVIDIPAISPFVTKYITESGTCSGCNQRWNSHPPGLPAFSAGAAGVMLGNSVSALAVQLRTQLGVPLRKIATFLKDVFGIKVSHGGVLGLLERAGKALEPTKTHLIETLRTSSRVCADETGWRMENESAWAWVFADLNTTCYVVDKSRGHGVVLELLGPKFEGILQSDCFLAYLPLPYKKAKCLAHLLKSLKELEALQPEDKDKQFSKDAVQLVKEAIGLEWRREELSGDQYQVACLQLEQRLDRLLDENITESADENNLKLAKRMKRYRDEWLVFLYEGAVDATNNLAERQIRPFVLHRKISAGNRSKWGAALHATLMSVFSTSVQRGANLLDVVLRALSQPQVAHL